MSSAPNNITRLPTANVTAIETRDALAKEERARANELAVNDDREMLPQRDDEARRELALEGADDETFSLVPMPQPDHNWSYMLISFGIVVLLPLCLLGMYFLFLATPQYFAEFRFSVTEVTPSAGPLGGGASGGTTASAVASAMGGHGAAVGGGSAQNFVVIDYLKSRQVVDELSQTVDVREIYSRPEIDWPNRFDRSRSTEHLVRYWNKMVWANYDPLTGLASVEIKAFRPDDALTIANQLVTLSETLVNKIAKRAEEDAVKFAEQEVVRAKASLDKARAAMAEFREKEGVIDPIPSVVSGNTQLIGTLRGSVSQLEADYDTIRRQNLSETAPSVLALKSRVQAAREQLALRRARSLRQPLRPQCPGGRRRPVRVTRYGSAICAGDPAHVVAIPRPCTGQRGGPASLSHALRSPSTTRKCRRPARPPVDDARRLRARIDLVHRPAQRALALEQSRLSESNLRHRTRFLAHDEATPGTRQHLARGA